MVFPHLGIAQNFIREDVIDVAVGADMKPPLGVLWEDTTLIWQAVPRNLLVSDGLGEPAPVEALWFKILPF